MATSYINNELQKKMTTVRELSFVSFLVYLLHLLRNKVLQHIVKMSIVAIITFSDFCCFTHWCQS